MSFVVIGDANDSGGRGDQVLPVEPVNHAVLTAGLGSPDQERCDRPNGFDFLGLTVVLLFLNRLLFFFGDLFTVLIVLLLLNDNWLGFFRRWLQVCEGSLITVDVPEGKELVGVVRNGPYVNMAFDAAGCKVLVLKLASP